MDEYSQFLKDKIETSGISKREISMKGGLEESAVKQICYGRSKNPKIWTIEGLAKGLECSPLELLPPKWPKNSSPINNNTLQNAILKVMAAIENDAKKPDAAQMASAIDLVYNKLQNNHHLTKGEVTQLFRSDK